MRQIVKTIIFGFKSRKYLIKLDRGKFKLEENLDQIWGKNVLQSREEIYSIELNQCVQKGLVFYTSEDY